MWGGMKKRNFVNTLSSIAVMLLSLAVYPLHAANRGWIYHSLSYKVNSRLTLAMGSEMRYETLTFSDRYLYNWRGTAAYRIGGGFYAAAGYQLVKVETLQFTLKENRILLDIGWNKRFAGKFDLGFRLRTENRSFVDNLAEDHMRFRLKAKLSAQMRLGFLELRPFAAIEAFGDNKDKEINRYRFYVGTIVTVTRNLGIRLCYIRQTSKHRETLHVLATGLKLSF